MSSRAHSFKASASSSFASPSRRDLAPRKPSRLRRGPCAASVVLFLLPLACLIPISLGAKAQLTEFCQFTGNPGPCGPYDQYQDAIGQELRMTLMLLPKGKTATEPPAAAAPAPLPQKLNTIRDVFGALRACFAAAPFGDNSEDLAATINSASRATAISSVSLASPMCRRESRPAPDRASSRRSATRFCPAPPSPSPMGSAALSPAGPSAFASSNPQRPP